MDVDSYAESLAVQLRKGFLVYCVLLVCSNKAQYAGDIVKQLNDSDLTVVEGTIYPLLNRLQKRWIFATRMAGKRARSAAKILFIDRSRRSIDSRT